MNKNQKYNIPIPGPGRDSFKEKYGEDAHRFQARIPKSLFAKLARKATAKSTSTNDYLIQILEKELKP